MAFTTLFRSHFARSAAMSFLAVAISLAFTNGCDKSDSGATAAPKKPTSPAEKTGGADDAALMKRFINEKGGEGEASSSALPSGHPPVSGATPPASIDMNGPLPKGHPPLPPGMRIAGADAATAAPDPADLPLQYEIPESWSAQAPASNMRKAQYLLPRAADNLGDGEMILYFFGAQQGGPVDANIQRWVGQFTTADGEPIPESGRIVVSSEVNGLKITTLDIAGHYSNTTMGGAAGPSSDPQRMLAAVVETPGGRWFFKGTGPLDTMAKHKSAFDSMLQTLTWKSDADAKAGM